MILIYFEAALGAWDNGIYEEPYKSEWLQDPHVAPFVMEFGKIYNMAFLMINLVLLLNLVIAILSNTFG